MHSTLLSRQVGTHLDALAARLVHNVVALAQHAWAGARREERQAGAGALNAHKHAAAGPAAAGACLTDNPIKSPPTHSYVDARGSPARTGGPP